MALFRRINAQFVRSVAQKLQSVFQQGQLYSLKRLMSSEPSYNYETLEVTRPSKWVAQVQINRPDKLNAMNKAFWSEITDCFNTLAIDSECRVVVLSAAGRLFTAGLDMRDAADLIMVKQSEDVGRNAALLARKIKSYQDSFTAIEQCQKPVIAAIHNACIGGGVDMTSACDIRLCSEDAWFQIKEVDIGLAADVGTLQRFPKVIGNDSLFRELTYTARVFKSDEAKDMGFVSRIYKDKDSLIAAALEIATEIGSKSPIAVQGSKVNIIYSRDHSVSEALNYQVAWNAAMLQSEDLMKAAMASMQKETPVFEKA